MTKKFDLASFEQEIKLRSYPISESDIKFIEAKLELLDVLKALRAAFQNATMSLNGVKFTCRVEDIRELSLALTALDEKHGVER